VENVDRAIADGTHYAGGAMMPELPAIPCFDGIGRLPDGQVVGFGNPRAPYGALAERTVVPRGNHAPIPDGIDPATATVLASAITGMSMRTAAGLRDGETVLIQGATGVSGRLAVQIARLLNAGRVVVTGRDQERLDTLGADKTINTACGDEELLRRYGSEHYDVVLDFLWGRPTEVLLRSLIPTGFAFAAPTRLVQIGESAGDSLTVKASSLRTSGVEIYGAARGLDGGGMAEAYARVVTWTRNGDLTYDLERAQLGDIETVWSRTDRHGRRLVITM
jgi:NADPH:quinone reductase-like Zn-dependent oxidoreductase